MMRDSARFMRIWFGRKYLTQRITPQRLEILEAIKSTCSDHVIWLSKIIPSYLKWSTFSMTTHTHQWIGQDARNPYWSKSRWFCSLKTKYAKVTTIDLLTWTIQVLSYCVSNLYVISLPSHLWREGQWDQYQQGRIKAHSRLAVLYINENLHNQLFHADQKTVSRGVLQSNEQILGHPEQCHGYLRLHLYGIFTHPNFFGTFCICFKFSSATTATCPLIDCQ